MSSTTVFRQKPHTFNLSYNKVLAEHVINGLSSAKKSLSSKWFYDDEGARLFQQIKALPEYYLTQAEHDIITRSSELLAHWIAPSAQPVDLIELGSGDGEKALLLCQALHQRRKSCYYYPIDLSPLALKLLSQRFEQNLPGVTVHPLKGDFSTYWPQTTIPQHRQVVLFLGSNLGNLNHDQAVALLKRIRHHLHVGDALVLGLDLQKNPQIIQAAYNDKQGLTARFNLNLLTRLNRELAMDFDLEQFSHYASYSPLDGAAHSFLVSACRQTIYSQCLKREFSFLEGEPIYTEQAQKYNRPMIEQLANQTGFHTQTLLLDSQGWYALAIWQAVSLV